MEKRKNVAWRVRRKSGGWEKKGVNEGLATSAETSYESRKAGRGGEKQRSKGVLVERRRETMERRAVGSAAGDDRGKRREKRRHRRILIETSVRLIKNHCRLRSRGEIAVRVSLRGLALSLVSLSTDAFAPSTKRFVFSTLSSNPRLNAANSSEMQSLIRSRIRKVLLRFTVLFFGRCSLIVPASKDRVPERFCARSKGRRRIKGRG